VGDRSREVEGENWVFDPAVTRLSTHVAVIITQVTLVELGEGEGWAHISWVFIMAKGSIEYIVAYRIVVSFSKAIRTHWKE